MKNEEDNNAQLPEQQENSRVQKKGRWCRIVLFVLLLFFVISVGTLTVLAAMIFSEPKQIPVRPLTEKEYQVQQKITRHLGKDLFRKRPKLISQIVFTQEEMTSLLNLTDSCLTAVKLAGKYRGINLRDLEPVFRKGELSIVYPIDTGRRWLFGGVIRLQMTGTPYFAEKKLQIELKECHLGRLFLPSEKVQLLLLFLFLRPA